MILSFKIKGDVISDYFLMLWFQKDSQDTVSFRTFRSGVPKIKSWILVDQSDIWISKCTKEYTDLPIKEIVLNFTNFFFWWLP